MREASIDIKYMINAIALTAKAKIPMKVAAIIHSANSASSGGPRSGSSHCRDCPGDSVTPRASSFWRFSSTATACEGTAGRLATILVGSLAPDIAPECA
jgi:hypothetical protein